jgi:16S rRNA A1518/A1519 N6-dimethyltransferase RsmA/KsgA/DIM1 with predicted DNA glycosylase/AP lyase activity
MKHMKRKFRHFSPVMHAVMRERRKKLKQKFRNAVYVIMWMQRLAV